MRDESQHPIARFSKAAVALGWRYVPAIDPDTFNSNADALDVGGRTFSTIISPDGNVKVGLSSTAIYMHNNNVWYGDPSEWKPDQLTLTGIYVNPNARNQGLASQAMRFVNSLADQLGMTLSLEPMPFKHKGEPKGTKRMTSTQLKKWYSQLGYNPSQQSSSIMRYTPKSDNAVDGRE